MKNQKTYPIKAVSKITGISQHVLRAWEKRYNLVDPIRTTTNRRLYTENDLEKLKLLKKLTEEGYNIGSIAELEVNELSDLLTESKPSGNGSSPKDNENFEEAKYYYDQCLNAVYDFDSEKLEQNLNSALVKLGNILLLEKIIVPLVRDVGHNWEVGEIRIYQEHMVSVVIKSFLLSILDSYKRYDSDSNILVTTPQGQIHEIGAILAAINAASAGWNVNYLGTELPTEEIVAAAVKLNAKAVAISIVYKNEDHHLTRDLMKLGKILPNDIKLFVGGSGADNYNSILSQINAYVIQDFADFRNVLKQIRTA